MNYLKDEQTVIAKFDANEWRHLGAGAEEVMVFRELKNECEKAFQPVGSSKAPRGVPITWPDVPGLGITAQHKMAVHRSLHLILVALQTVLSIQ